MEQLETTLAAIAGANTIEAVEAIRVAALGKQGWVSALLKSLGGMTPDDDSPGMAGFMTGSVATMNPDGKRRGPPREFPPGFHVAAPGPSHEETPKPKSKQPAMSRSGHKLPKK